MAVALGIAALALFFLPAVLGLGSPNSGGGASPSPSVAAVAVGRADADARPDAGHLRRSRRATRS